MLDQTRSEPPAPADLDPDGLPVTGDSVWRLELGPDQRSWPRGSGRNLRDLPAVMEMPLLFHSIWLGGPLTDTEFRENVADLAARTSPSWRVLVWTDVPRDTFARALQPPAGGPDPLAAVRKMLVWALDSGVLLINVDEVFHAGAPMPLAEFYRMELAKRVGLGYGAASDILRLAILDRFGGLYSDGDNRLVSLDDLRDVFNQYGFAVHASDDSPKWNNSALLAARQHPFARRYLDAIERNYALTQADLLGPERVRPPVRVQNAEWVTNYGLRLLRHSVLFRTGPFVFRDVVPGWAGAEETVAFEYLPTVTQAQITMGRASSWGTWSPLDPPRRYGPAAVAQVARDATATLIRELYNREGDLHLTYVAPVIAGLPDPAAAWRAIITFILSQPGLRPITTVTDRLLHLGDGEAGTVVLVVDLPADVRAALGLSDGPDGHDPPGIWRLAELMRPVRPPFGRVQDHQRPAVVVPALPGLWPGYEQSAGDAGPGEFNAESFDRRWGRLDAERLGDAVDWAQLLIHRAGRTEPLIGVMEETAIRQLDPLGQAVRWLAMQIYPDLVYPRQVRPGQVRPGLRDEVGAAALAGVLAARLNGVLGPPPPGRLPGGGFLCFTCGTRHVDDPAGSVPLAEVASQPVPRRLSDFLDRSLWWMLYLNPRDHERAMLAWPDDPGQLYDRENSPGFQAGMVRAYERVLDPSDGRFGRLNGDGYRHLLDLVSSGLRNRPSWTGDPGPDMDFPLHAERLAQDMLAEHVAGRPLVAALTITPAPSAAGAVSSQDQRAALALTELRLDEPGRSRVLVGTRYRLDEARGLADAALVAYYEEIGAARDDTARLTAIARLIRSLHVMHLFSDANGRLNVYLLLPRLLLENGFRPVIATQSHVMFNGSWSLEQIVAILRASQEGAVGQILPPPDPRVEVARQVIDQRDVARRRILSDFQPDEGSWWPWYISVKDHELSMLLLPENPGGLYDREMSPGFQADMLHAYRQVLNPQGRRFEQLDSVSYLGLMNLVTAGQGHTPSWTGEPAGEMKFFLGAERMAEDMLDEYVAGRPLVAALSVRPDRPPADTGSSQEDQRAAQALTTLEYRPDSPTGFPLVMVGTRYSQAGAPGLADAALSDYYEEIGEATDDTARLSAIARLTRRLHVMHLFTEANGRVNIYLLLYRLLLENGFSPVNHPEMHSMFNGGWSLEQIVAALREEQPAISPAAGDLSVLILPPPDPRPELARRVIESLPQYGWIGAPPPEPSIIDVFRNLRDQRIDMGRTVADIAAYITRHVAAYIASTRAEQEGRPARRLSDYMPRNGWQWLYLAPEHHDEAWVYHPDDQGALYDHDNSPGYQAAMEGAYEEVLDPPDRRFERLDGPGYLSLLARVTTGLQGTTPSWNGTGLSIRFPLNAERMAGDMLTEHIAGRPLIVGLEPHAAGSGSLQEDERAARALISVDFYRPDSPAVMVGIRYGQDEAPALADAALNEYYVQIGEAGDDAARLRAIARLIRRLHVMHLFTDANGRLNVYLLLHRMLLENGFRPVIHPDLSSMFNGGWSLDRIVAVLAAAQPDRGQAAGDPAARILPPSDPRPWIARQVVEMLPGLEWTGVVPSEADVLDAMVGLRHDPGDLGQTAEEIADEFARMIAEQQAEINDAGPPPLSRDVRWAQVVPRRPAQLALLRMRDEVADRYLAAYDGVRMAAPALGLAPDALRRLVFDLLGLAGPGGELAEYLEVLGNQDILDRLADIQRYLGLHGSAELVALVNDMLLSAALVPSRETPVRRPGRRRYHDVRVIESVSPIRLRSVLTQLAVELVGGRDPMAEPGLASIGYRPGQPAAERLARLALLNLGDQVRARVATDPLFGALLASPLLTEALFAASGAEEQFFLNTCTVAAVDQILLAQVPTIAGLLIAGRNLVAWVQDRVTGGTGALHLPDRTGLGPLRRPRTIGELAQARIRQATAEFNAIGAAVTTLLATPGLDSRTGGQQLRALTERWSRVMQKLGGVVMLGQTDGQPDIPVLTRRIVRDTWELSLVLAGPTGVDRYRRRATGIRPHDYLIPINSQLAARALEPARSLAPRLASADHRARFWDIVRDQGGILLRAGPESDRHLIYLRAVRRGDQQMFALGDPLHSNYEFVPLSVITAWARERDAQVHQMYLLTDLRPALTSPRPEPVAGTSAAQPGRRSVSWNVGVPRPLLGGVRVVVTRSGWYFPARGGVWGDEAESRAAALRFPVVENATVLHLHTDPDSGHLVVGERVVPPEDFHAEFGRRLGEPPGRLVVMVACAAAARGAAEPVAVVLARLGGGPVLAADTDVWTTADGRVLAARAGVDEQGRPVPGELGSWVLVRSGGQEQVRLGADLLGGALPVALLEGGQRPLVIDGQGRRRSARAVRWSQPDLAGSGLGAAMDWEPEPNQPGGQPQAVPHLPPSQPGPAGLEMARRYLRVSGVELPARVTYAEAEGWLAAMVAGAGAGAGAHPVAAAAAGDAGRALSLLGGLAWTAYYLNARLGGAEFDRYQPGAHITAGGFTVASADRPDLSGGQNVRFVILPLEGRSGRYASRGRETDLLLGAGTAVFPPGTVFFVSDRRVAGAGTDGSQAATVVLAEIPGVWGPVGPEDVIPATGPGVRGLNQSLHRYLYLRDVDAELGWWSVLEAEQRQAQGPALLARLLAAANARLAASGVPALALDAERVISTNGEFFVRSWSMALGAVPVDRDDVPAAASTIWHEARHAEQFFLALRYLASEDEELFTTAYSRVNVPEVLQRAWRDRTAPGSPEYEAGRYWAFWYFGPPRAEYRAISARLSDLTKALVMSVDELDQAELRGARQADLDKLQGAVAVAAQKRTQHAFRPYVSTAPEWDAFRTESLLRPIRRLELPGPPGTGGERPVFLHTVGAGEQATVRLWLGVEPSTAADLLVSHLADDVLVHGRGMDGRLHVGGVPVDTGWLLQQLSERADSSLEVVLLASDADVTAQELADARGNRVWAPPPRAAGRVRLADVWVSLGTGAVAVGVGGLTEEGTLQIVPAALHCYQPRSAAGRAGLRGGVAAVPQSEVGLAPTRILTQAQALADPGPWQRRTARLPVGPLDWEDHMTTAGWPVSVGRAGGGVRQVLLLQPGDNASGAVRDAAAKMVLPDEVAAAVHVHGRPGQGPALAAGHLAAVLESLGVPRRPVWLVSSGAAAAGRGVVSYAKQFAAVWGSWVIASRELVWVRFDGVVVASSLVYGREGVPVPVDPPDGQHQKFFPGRGAPRNLGAVLPPVPRGTTLGDGPWQPRSEGAAVEG